MPEFARRLLASGGVVAERIMRGRAGEEALLTGWDRRTVPRRLWLDAEALKLRLSGPVMHDAVLRRLAASSAEREAEAAVTQRARAPSRRRAAAAGVEA